MTDMIETLNSGCKRDQPKKTWTGRYKDINYEIDRWFMGYDESDLDYHDLVNEMWNYYITINLERIKDQDKQDKLWLDLTDSVIGDDKFYSSMDIDVNTDIEFHGGCTYYKKQSGLERDKRIIQIGCDYGHYKDIPPRLDRALKGTKRTIESFYDWVGTYLRRCTGCGKYFEPGTGVKNDAGWEYKCGGEKDYCN